jgi:hypothetical protein
MKTALQTASICSLAVLLAACGSSDIDSSQTLKSSPQAMRNTGAASSAQHAPADYTSLVQSIYMGFFGRPADPQGLIFWSNSMSSGSLPTTLPELIAGYSASDEIRGLLDAFANSAESKSLYVANNASFINAVYLNAFNRNAEADGRVFWSGFLDRGQYTRAQVVLFILSAGQNDDAIVAPRKIQAATTLTSLLDTEQEVKSFEGDQVNEAARVLLGTITADTDMTAFRAKIDTFVASLGGSDTPFAGVSRYVGYHYLQDMSNTPAYAAHYSYSSGGFTGPANSGTLTYGERPQTVAWSRDRTTRALTHGAPVVATASLPSSGFLPMVTMLCTAAQGATGSLAKSTDVLVARAAQRVLDAAELAGQTLSIYRENCAVGGSNVQSFVFDAAGNGRFASPSGVLSLDAKSVTAVLNGQVLPDLSTGKFIVFSAYRYTRIDGTVGYAIIQHLGNRLTAVSDGVVAVWSQE